MMGKIFAAYCAALFDEFVEVESGKGADALDRRPQLAEALSAARKADSPVIVAKLCRLSRDVHFISGLMAHRVLVAKRMRTALIATLHRLRCEPP